SRQREANFTAFQTTVNRLFLPLSIYLTEPLQTQTSPPEEVAHSTQLSLLCNPYFKSNFLFYKKFKGPLTPEELRIIGTENPRSTEYCAFVSKAANSRARTSPHAHAACRNDKAVEADASTALPNQTRSSQ
ncbi:hypothetical protein ACF8PU_19370, partial [Pseudomonas sp. GLN_6]|uniref:hypothetical protein n=1 Tax=Pseudomonas sp. GLN_6 TaxID=3367183 RepID=UPI00370BF26A